MTEPRPEVLVSIWHAAMLYSCTDAEVQAAVDLVKSRTRRGRRSSGRSARSEPRPEVVTGIRDVMLRYGCTDEELQAVVDLRKQRKQRGRPKSKIYGPHLWAMRAL